MDAASIKKLLKDFTGHDVGQDKCNDFLRSVDENGDSVIEKHELQHFIENGIALEKEDRNEYSERGGLHKTIVEFFDGVSPDYRAKNRQYSSLQNSQSSIDLKSNVYAVNLIFTKFSKGDIFTKHFSRPKRQRNVKNQQ